MILSREGDIWCIYAQARLMVVHEFLFTEVMHIFMGYSGLCLDMGQTKAFLGYLLSLFSF